MNGRKEGRGRLGGRKDEEDRRMEWKEGSVGLDLRREKSF